MVILSISRNSPKPSPLKQAHKSAMRIWARLYRRTRLPWKLVSSRKQGKFSARRFTRAAAERLELYIQFRKLPSKSLHSTRPASCRHPKRSLSKGISSSVAERKTCLSKSSVHSSSLAQNSGVVIGISASLSIALQGNSQPEGKPTFIQGPLQGRDQAPVASPLPAAVLDGKALLIRQLGPEAEIEQVHGEDEVDRGGVLGLRVQFVLRSGCGVPHTVASQSNSAFFGGGKRPEKSLDSGSLRGKILGRGGGKGTRTGRALGQRWTRWARWEGRRRRG